MDNFKRLLEDFESEFLGTLKKMKTKSGIFDPDDDEMEDQNKKNLDMLVKILNQNQGTPIPEKVYYKMVQTLFPKDEAKRIINHFLRRKLISGEYTPKGTEYQILKKIEKRDYLNFY